MDRTRNPSPTPSRGQSADKAHVSAASQPAQSTHHEVPVTGAPQGLTQDELAASIQQESPNLALRQNLRGLSKPATAIFNRVLEVLGDASHVKIDNNSPDSAFMPLSVDKLYENRHGTVYALAHNFEQNGDLCTDPDMEFLVLNDDSDCIYPLSFEMNFMQVYRRGVTFEADGKFRLNRGEQADQAAFANKWMQNIAHQQGLKPLYSERVLAQKAEQRGHSIGLKQALGKAKELGKKAFLTGQAFAPMENQALQDLCDGLIPKSGNYKDLDKAMKLVEAWQKGWNDEGLLQISVGIVVPDHQVGDIYDEPRILQQAEELGRQAFRDGKKSVPAHDSGYLELVPRNAPATSLGFKRGARSAEAWLKGYIDASRRDT